jgi:hypothetical protein
MKVFDIGPKVTDKGERMRAVQNNAPTRIYHYKRIVKKVN